MDEIAIVELTPDRWADYRSLRLDALRTDPQAFGARLEESEAHPPDYWRTRLSDAALRQTNWLTFAEMNDQLVGLVGAFRLDDSPDATLVSMWVRPEFRRHGIARRLVQTQIDSIRASRPDLTGIRLMVHSTQPAALKLYESFGFRTVNVDGVELTMFRPL